ncbi:MAG: SDR family oxidoreductase [Deltaproteobacteria bacterium]|nr:SDR family oxidoreductase [Deltaproteobacteria bacterium]
MRDAQQVFRLEGRVAVVTGAASGIGRAAAEVLAAAGARVVVGDLDARGAEEVAAAIRADGGAAVAQRVNVATREEVDALVARAISEWGRLDVMCNVAGVPSDGPLGELAESEFDRVVAINVKGTLFGCQAAVRAMTPRGSGSIINVASGAIDRAVPNYGLYALTKAAVTQLTQTLATEVGAAGIRVNVLAPGATLTKFTERHLRRPDGSLDPARYDAFVASMKSMSPLGLVGDPLDQAWLVLFLASDASRFCTGQVWRSNGGATIPR